jgi:hypothetical protein
MAAFEPRPLTDKEKEDIGKAIRLLRTHLMSRCTEPNEAARLHYTLDSLEDIGRLK